MGRRTESQMEEGAARERAESPSGRHISKVPCAGSLMEAEPMPTHLPQLFSASHRQLSNSMERLGQCPSHCCLGGWGSLMDHPHFIFQKPRICKSTTERGKSSRPTFVQCQNPYQLHINQSIIPSKGSYL